MENIRNAINAGKEVTTHQSTLSYGKWTGSGYIILDKTTGTGVYLIDGGANGAVMIFYGAWLNSMFALCFVAVVGAFVSGGFIAGIGALAIIAVIIFPFILFILSRVIKAFNPKNDPEHEKRLLGCLALGFLDSSFVFSVMAGAGLLTGAGVGANGLFLLEIFSFFVGKNIEPSTYHECIMLGANA